jgi:surfactin synthase thioesterase subunit
MFDGGHFFLDGARDAVIVAVTEAVAQAAVVPGRRHG